MANCCEKLPIELGREGETTKELHDEELALRKRINKLDSKWTEETDYWFAYQCTQCGQYWWVYTEDIRWGPDSIYHKVSKAELLEKFPDLKLPEGTKAK